MKYFFYAILLGSFVVALRNSNMTTTPRTNDNETKKASQCYVNNSNYNSFFAEPNSKKVENMFSEVKQQLNELKQEIKEIKGNKTGGPGGKGLSKKLQQIQHFVECDAIVSSRAWLRLN